MFKRDAVPERGQIQAAVLYLLFGLLMVVTLAVKQEYHIDEFFSYALANRAYDMTVEQGMVYEPAAQPYLDNLTADAGDRFNYVKVWDNQAEDVHPPLYYVLLHTVCSFFPGSFSVWYAGVINILFALGTLFVFRRLVRLYSDSSFVLLTATLSFVLSAGMLSAVSFLRMYIMAMCWVVLTAYLFAAAVIREETGVRFYAGIAAVAVLGALTHYYCIVYLVLSCVVFGLWLLCKRRWKDVLLFIAVMGASGGGAVLLFPAMLEHMFSGYRGTQSIENLSGTSAAEYWGRLKVFFRMINNEVFGGLLPVIVLFLAVGCLLAWSRAQAVNPLQAVREKWKDGGRKESGRNVGKSHKAKQSKRAKKAKKAQKAKRAVRKNDKPGRDWRPLSRWAVLIVPTAVYFLLVSRMAVYEEVRYLVPIYAVLLMIGVFALWKAVSVLGLAEKRGQCLMAVCVGVLLLGTWYKAEWRDLYLEQKERLELAQEYGDVNAIIVYNSLWRAKPAFKEISNYHSLTFVSDGNLQLLDSYEYGADGELILLAIGDSGWILDTVLPKLPNVDSYEELGKFGYHTTYRLYGSTPAP